MVPIILWGLSFLAGSAAGLLLPAAAPWAWGAATVLFLLQAVSFSVPDGRRPRLLLSVLLFLALGCARSALGEADFRTIQRIHPDPVEGRFRGWVAEDPEVLFERMQGCHETGREGDRYAPYVQRARAVVVITEIDGVPIGSLKARASFLCSAKSPAPVLAYGDPVDMKGRLALPPVALNPGQFDYRGYLRNRGVAYVLSVAPGRWERAVGPKRGSVLGRTSYAFKRRVEDAVTRFLPYPENALLSGLLLGERASLTDGMLEAFAVTGTTHILAVSGMNTALIAGVLFLGFRVLRAPRKAAAFLSILALGGYVFMTGGPPSVCRAALFSSLALLGVLTERKPHAGVLLVLTAALLTAFQPGSLTDLSFQLSFLAVMGLAVFTPRFLGALKRLPAFLSVDLAATAGAQLAVWGLILAQFNQFATHSLLANVLIAPLVAFATIGGFAAVMADLLHPALGTWLGAGVEPPLRLLTFVTSWLSRWPHAEIVVGTPPPAWVAVYHGLLLAFFLAYWPRPEPQAPSPEWMVWDSRFQAARRGVLLAWAVFVLAVGGALLGRAIGPRPFRAAFLAVGHGNAAVFRAPGGKTVVVDGGRRTDGPARWNLLVRYLRHEGIGRVDALINTHPDSDHVGGLVDLASLAEVGEAFQPEGVSALSETAWEFEALLAEKGVPVRRLKRGDGPDLLPGTCVRVLHPPGTGLKGKGGTNDSSLVLQVRYPREGQGFLLTIPGDVEREGLLELERAAPERGGWLVAPHHGRESGEPRLAARTFAPDVVIVSDSQDHPEAVRDFAPAEVYPLRETGCVEVSVDAKGRVCRRFFRDERASR